VSQTLFKHFISKNYSLKKSIVLIFNALIKYNNFHKILLFKGLKSLSETLVNNKIVVNNQEVSLKPITTETQPPTYINLI